MQKELKRNPNPPSPGPAGSVFLDWFHTGQWAGAGKDAGQLAQAAWDAAILAAASECLQYAHSGQNVYRRQVAYACKRRIEALRSPNDGTEAQPGKRASTTKETP